VSDFGKRLKEERLLWGMTQADLAAETGIARDKIGRIETNDRKATADELLAFARAFQTTVDDLLAAGEASIRYRVNPDAAETKRAIEWFERCVENSLFISRLANLYGRG
jgi:transcriptional regulator with XRE-family HTH domain